MIKVFLIELKCHAPFNNVKANEAIRVVLFMTTLIWLGWGWGGAVISAFLNWLGHHADEESSDSPADLHHQPAEARKS